jgi:hypothetical protein
VAVFVVYHFLADVLTFKKQEEKGGGEDLMWVDSEVPTSPTSDFLSSTAGFLFLGLV